MVETNLWRCGQRHRLAAEVEQLRVACLYREDLSPSAGDRFPLRRPGRPARGRAGAWASKGLSLPAGKVAPAARPARRHDHPGWGDPALSRTARRWQPTTPRWSAARRPARSSPRMRPAGASAAGAAPRTAGRGLCRVARPDRGRKRDRRCHRTRREFRKPRLMEATRTRLHPRARCLTRLAALSQGQTRRILRPT